MTFSEIKRMLVNTFQRQIKNIVSLGDDSTLDKDLKPVKIGGVVSKLELSQSKVRVNGTLDVDSIGDSVFVLNSSDDDRFISFGTSANAGGDRNSIASEGSLAGLELKSDGIINFSAETVTAGSGYRFLNGVNTYLCYINYYTSATRFRLNENGGATGTDYFEIACAANGATTIFTVDAAGITGHLTLEPDGDLIFNPKEGKYIAQKDGTEFSAADSAYAGMILGYTDIGLDEATATYNTTTSFVVPTSEFKVAFTAPPSGQVEISMQVMYDVGSSNVADLYAGLSDSAIYHLAAGEDIHQVEIYDAMSRGAIRM